MKILITLALLWPVSSFARDQAQDCKDVRAIAAMVGSKTVIQTALSPNYHITPDAKAWLFKCLKGMK